jgi:integrase
MSRKSPGEGSVYKRSDGVWCAALQMEGKRRIVYSKTEREARAKLLSIQKEVSRSGLITSTGNKTVNDLLDLWLDTSEPTLKPRTIHDYNARCSRHIRPALCQVKLSRLSPERIQSYYSILMKRGLTREATYSHALLHRACRLAVLWGWLPSNPCDRVIRPKHQPERKQMWTTEELCQFLDATEGHKLHPLWVVAATSGCRLSEMLALKWQDIDLATGHMRVCRSLHRIGGQWVESTPKTKAGDRTIILPQKGILALRQQKAQQASWKLKSGEHWQNTTLIFIADDGSPMHQSAIQQRMKRECERIKPPPMTPHGLRHMAASVLLAKGLPVPAVSARLGHASPNITMTIYAYALKHQDQQAAALMQEALSR